MVEALAPDDPLIDQLIEDQQIRKYYYYGIEGREFDRKGSNVSVNSQASFRSEEDGSYSRRAIQKNESLFLLNALH